MTDDALFQRSDRNSLSVKILTAEEHIKIVYIRKRVFKEFKYGCCHFLKANYLGALTAELIVYHTSSVDEGIDATFLHFYPRTSYIEADNFHFYLFHICCYASIVDAATASLSGRCFNDVLRNLYLGGR